jgi:hypothetical protein
VLLGGLSLASALARPQGTALDGTSIERTSPLPVNLHFDFALLESRSLPQTQSSVLGLLVY